MEKISFADGWESIFDENGLKSFNDFYDYRDKTCLNRNRKRNVSVLRLKVSGKERVFYMKRFYHPHLKDTLFAMVNSGRLCSQADYEQENMRLLTQYDIPSCNPVCFGEQFCLGLERRSFLITEELPGPCLTDFLAQNRQNLYRSEKEQIITSIANLVRKIHTVKINLPDLYVWHFFLMRSRGGHYDFAVIDLNRMKRNCTSENERIKNLGRLWFSMTDKHFDTRMHRFLVKQYLGNVSDEKLDRFTHKVQKCAEKLAMVRKQPAY